ncbi:MAG: membrane integrity-associated transporter subunit PqiC [Lentisphaeria bacterium]|nr:membrane integrity-associated transporter subunit PqiC [Lentisphaeria bacterium]
MKRFLLCCAAALLPFLAACSFNLIPQTDFTETRTFDLAAPEPLETLPFIVDVEAFSNECSGRFKMVFREDANRVEVDEYNRWSTPPAAMLTKYLAARFAAQTSNQGRTGKPVFVLDGSVLNCEMNRTKKQADLMVHFFVVEQGDDTFRITGTKDYAIPVENATAEAFADGMNKAASQFADHIVSVLKDELRKRDDEAKAAGEKK